MPRLRERGEECARSRVQYLATTVSKGKLVREATLGESAKNSCLWSNGAAYRIVPSFRSLTRNAQQPQIKVCTVRPSLIVPPRESIREGAGNRCRALKGGPRTPCGIQRVILSGVYQSCVSLLLRVAAQHLSKGPGSGWLSRWATGIIVAWHDCCAKRASLGEEGRARCKVSRNPSRALCLAPCSLARRISCRCCRPSAQAHSQQPSARWGEGKRARSRLRRAYSSPISSDKRRQGGSPQARSRDLSNLH